MKTIGENSDRDMFRGTDGNIAMFVDVRALGQYCKSAMEAQRGEMIYQVNAGMPMRATAFDQFNPAQFEAAARATLLTIDGVNSVDQFDVQRVADQLVYSATIATIYGTSVITNA